MSTIPAEIAPYWPFPILFWCPCKKQTTLSFRLFAIFNTFSWMVTQILELNNRKQKLQLQQPWQCSKTGWVFFFLRKLLIVYRISSMTYFNKYLDIYRYSRNGTFLFFSSNCFTFLYKPKYLPFYLCSCKISLLRLMKNKKDLLILFFHPALMCTLRL